MLLMSTGVPEGRGNAPYLPWLEDSLPLRFRAKVHAIDNGLAVTVSKVPFRWGATLPV